MYIVNPVQKISTWLCLLPSQVTSSEWLEKGPYCGQISHDKTPEIITWSHLWLGCYIELLYYLYAKWFVGRVSKVEISFTCIPGGEQVGGS